MKRTRKLSDQVIKKVKTKIKHPPTFEGDMGKITSTGSTLLDLAISGGRSEFGGLPSGILVEVFGPSGAGKTVLLTEIAGSVKRNGGEVMFKDPEARLDKQFAKLFDLDIDQVLYDQPDTVPQVFEPIRKWEPEGDNVHGIFADSMAALSTDMEMGGTDKYGMRRAKEFSEQLRQTCRHIKKKNFLMVVSNQVRVNVDAGMFEEKYSTPGGMGLPFYASVRLKVNRLSKITKEVSIKGKKLKRVIGIKTLVDVYKSSVDKPFRQAPITIVFDYGIDDIRENLQYIKDMTGAKNYMVGDVSLGIAMEDAIRKIEEGNLERKLKRQVVNIWRNVESKFTIPRKSKKR